MLVNLDFIALQLDTNLLQTDIFGVGFDADSRQNHICNECFGPLLALDIYLATTLVIDTCSLDGCARIDRCAHLAEGALHCLRHLLVFERHKVGQILDDSHLDTQLSEQECELATDCARSNYDD